MATVPFNEADVKNYLDRNIKYWRKEREQTVTEVNDYVAACYIDAYQSMRYSLFGELLKK